MGWRHEFTRFARRAWCHVQDRAPWMTVARAASSAARSSGKVRMWRRRWLQLRGVHMRMNMAANVGEYSLAMLDEAGVVVSWYERAAIDAAAAAMADEAVDAHVRQLYVFADVVTGVPQRSLRIAAARGICIEYGWRHRTGGGVYWGTTIIRSAVNRNGQLQGFSRLTRPSPRAWQESHSRAGAAGQFEPYSPLQVRASTGARAGPGS